MYYSVINIIINIRHVDDHVPFITVYVKSHTVFHEKYSQEIDVFCLFTYYMLNNCTQGTRVLSVPDVSWHVHYLIILDYPPSVLTNWRQFRFTFFTMHNIVFKLKVCDMFLSVNFVRNKNLIQWTLQFACTDCELL